MEQSAGPFLCPPRGAPVRWAGGSAGPACSAVCGPARGILARPAPRPGRSGTGQNTPHGRPTVARCKVRAIPRCQQAIITKIIVTTAPHPPPLPHLHHSLAPPPAPRHRVAYNRPWFRSVKIGAKTLETSFCPLLRSVLLRSPVSIPELTFFLTLNSANVRGESALPTLSPPYRPTSVG